MPDEERLRWQELFSYISALVYHERVRGERNSLREALEKSLRKDEHRERGTDMRVTIADVDRDEGRQLGVVGGPSKPCAINSAGDSESCQPQPSRASSERQASSDSTPGWVPS
jgi:hypothetical protein